MFRKIKRLSKKYPLFSFMVVGGLLSVATAQAGLKGITGLLYVILSLTALYPATAQAGNTLKHGYFGIHVLPLTGLVFALILREYSTAFLLGLLLASEKPLLDAIERKHKPTQGRQLTFMQVRHAPFIRTLDRLSVPFILLVLMIGGSIWVVTGEAGRFLEVIAVASTAPLLLAAPGVYLRGMQAARISGLGFGSAGTYERLASAASVLLSKTGVLTSIDTEVKAVHAYGKHTQAAVLQVAASLAASSNHHLTRAIIAAAEKHGKPNKAKHTHETAGQGISGRMRGEDLAIGRLKFLESKGMALPAKPYTGNGPVVYVAQSNMIIGWLSFSEELLPGAKTLAKKLRKLGLQVKTASGSTAKSVAATATAAGISEHHGDTTAAERITLLESITKRPVVFVGNSASDGPVLTAADIGITTDENTDMQADMTITDYEPAKLAAAFSISRKTLRYARSFCLVTLFIALFLTVAATTGLFTPFQSAALNIILSVMTVTAASHLRIKV